MSQRVCPWWLGYLLANPIRRWFHNPAKILAPYVREGMTVLEPGPGMGFFTLDLARRVGPAGKVIAVDIQPKMLDALKRRLAKAGLIERVEVRLAQPDSMGLADRSGVADIALLFFMVHEVPDPAGLFAEVARTLKPGGTVLLVEPSGHVKPGAFQEELNLAANAGLRAAERPKMGRSLTALLKK